MPSVSLPPKENALFKRILVSGGRETGRPRGAGGGPRAALRRAAVTSVPPQPAARGAASALRRHGRLLGSRELGLLRQESR